MEYSSTVGGKHEQPGAAFALGLLLQVKLSSTLQPHQGSDTSQGECPQVTHTVLKMKALYFPPSQMGMKKYF